VGFSSRGVGFVLDKATRPASRKGKEGRVRGKKLCVGGGHDERRTLTIKNVKDDCLEKRVRHQGGHQS